MLNASKRTFTTQDGEELVLGKTSNAAIQMLQVEMRKKKPKIPVVEFTDENGNPRREENPDSPTYREELAVWEDANQTAVTKYVLLVGVKNKAPQDFIDEHREWFPDADDRELRFMWLMSLVPTPDEMGSLVNAIMGITAVTEQGLADARDAFHADGQRGPGDELPVRETPIGQHPETIAN